MPNRQPPRRLEPITISLLCALGILLSVACILVTNSHLDPVATPQGWQALSPVPTPSAVGAFAYELGEFARNGQPVADGPLLTPAPHITPSPKRGLADANPINCDVRTTCAEAYQLGASWIFNWGPRVSYGNCDRAGQAPIERVAMIWGASTLRNGCPLLISSSDWLLTFNEPDLLGRYHLPPASGAVLFRQVESCYPDKLLVSPAVVRNITWLQDTHQEYIRLYNQPPKWDALGLHCYAEAGKTLTETCFPLLDQLELWCTEWPDCQGIVINEFATSTHQTGWRDQMRAMLQRFETDPLVLRYAWYAARERGDEWFANGVTQLFECDVPTFTQAGILYRNFTPQRPAAYLPLLVAR